MKEISEFSTEKLVATEYTQYDEKTYAYKFKYFGNASGIVNIFVPNDVLDVMIRCGDDIKTTRLVDSIVYNGRKKYVKSDCLPINLNYYTKKKISLIMRSYAHKISTPEVIVVCEYLPKSSVTENESNLDSSQNKTDIKSDDPKLFGSEYRNTSNYINKSRNISIDRSTSEKYNDKFSPSSIPLGVFKFHGVASPNLSNPLEDLITNY